GKAEDQTNIQELQIIVRNLKEPPPTKPPPPPPRPLPPCPHELGQCPPLGEDGWVDLRVKSHKFPRCSVKALGRPLKLEDGSKQEQAVCLWYKHGEPVMGRAYDVGCLAATFGWEGKEFSGDVGSIQVLCYHSKEEQGFEITWRPFKDIRTEGWEPIHVKDCAPCVITTPSGAERLGKVQMSLARASVAWGKKEDIYTGPEVKEFMVLCRKPPMQ
ncbi:MAG: hypothetical protein GY696_25415, partial [Gammaproteobacteria bacterium]|nr:hypothetical protein [Gammaproteobacteria bacterium]